MTDPDAPIRTTHVGSLVRPAELVAYLRKIDAGEDYDEQAYQECLARSVRDVVQAQREAGIDIVSDGEFGKSAWNYYVYERLGGIELRPSPPGDANFASVNDAPTDWARFPEFYAAYFAHEQEYESPGGDWACVAPDRAPRPADRAREWRDMVRPWGSERRTSEVSSGLTS